MKVALSTRGSRGDVHPMLALAGALAARGHEVSSTVPQEFKAEAERRGLRAVVHSEASKEMMSNLGARWDAVKGVIEWISRSIEEQFEYLLEQTADADVLVASTTELAAPSVAEYRGIPYVRLSFAPWMTSRESNTMLPWQGLPGPVNYWAWKAVNVGTDLLAYAPTHRQRTALGLPRLLRVGEYVVLRGTSILAMSELLSPPCPSWRGKYRYQYSGYCYDPPGEPLPESLVAFVKNGPPPIYVGLGSIKVDDAQRFSEVVRDAALRAGCRVVLGCGWAGLGEGVQSSVVHLADNVDHQQLFPLLAGVVHHGGSGTTHVATRAGVPQLMLPSLADQFYWGHRIYKLGLGPRAIPLSKVTVANLASALSELRTTGYAQRAARMGRALAEDRGAERAAEIVEELAGAPAPAQRMVASAH